MITICKSMSILENSSVLNQKYYPSRFAIEDRISFYPMARQAKELSISREPRIGRIIAIRFSKAKVLYDIVDDYYGYVFKDVDSVYVHPMRGI